MENKEKSKRTRNQIEYYLSDENLARDQFFHGKIKDHPEGYVDIKYFLNCNKVVELGVSLEDIIAACEDSGLLDLNTTKDMVRRKDNKPLPELKLLKNKKQRVNDGDTENTGVPEPKEKSLTPIILEISADKPIISDWKLIKIEFKQLNPHLNVIYTRFDKTAGHLGVLAPKGEELTFNDTFKIGESTVKVKKCVGDALIDFWKNHGSHFEYCLGKQDKKLVRKMKDQGKEKPSTYTQKYLKQSVKLGRDTFIDVNKLKSKCRAVISKYGNGDALDNDDTEFVKDLIKFHKNANQKIENFDHFETDVHPEYQQSRCLFVVKQDGKKEDISLFKCVENLIDKQ